MSSTSTTTVPAPGARALPLTKEDGYIDFAFAIAFGIFFQYYSIAPMTGDYGLKTLYRAAKADFLSLVFFEVGLFAWMAIFQIAIFRWRLPMDTVTYWWMMQVRLPAATTSPSCLLIKVGLDWYVSRPLDRSADQLVVDQDRGQRAVRMIMVEANTGNRTTRQAPLDIVPLLQVQSRRQRWCWSRACRVCIGRK